jgi:hypothetical protein
VYGQLCTRDYAQKILFSLGLDSQGVEASVKQRFEQYLKPTESDATVNSSLKLVG